MIGKRDFFIFAWLVLAYFDLLPDRAAVLARPRDRLRGRRRRAAHDARLAPAPARSDRPAVYLRRAPPSEGEGEGQRRHEEQPVDRRPPGRGRRGTDGGAGSTPRSRRPNRSPGPWMFVEPKTATTMTRIRTSSPIPIPSAHAAPRPPFFAIVATPRRGEPTLRRAPAK